MGKLPKNKIRALVIIIIIALGCYSCKKGSSSGDKPNIVLIYADDLGYGDLGCYGATKVKTPHIDQLANQGRRFTDTHSASSVCSPSRYGLLAGRYPLQRNLWGPVGHIPLVIDTSFLTIGKVLKNAGYATACIGKWHLGFGTENPTNWNNMLKPGPLELGFDYYYGIPVVNSGPPFVYVENHWVVGLEPTDSIVYGEKSITQEWPEKFGYTSIGGGKKAHSLYRDEEIGTTLKDKAIEWMKNTHVKNEDKPFFLYLATTNIHHPFTPAPRFQGSSECGRYGDFIHELDWIVGEVLSALEEMGVADNTLVIFTSDNGGMLNLGGQDAWKAGHRINGDLLGFKFGAWEGGHNVPFIAKWPGKIPINSVSDQLISQVDLLATFAAIVDIPLDINENYNSINQLPALTGNPESMIRDLLIVSPNSPDHLVIRKDNWVYIPAQDEGGFKVKEIGDIRFGGAAALPFTGFKNSDIVNGEIRKDAPSAQLYDLSNDPYQTTNLYREYPEIVEQLQGLIENYRKNIGTYPKTGYIEK